jgi:hypothetical protein
MKRRITTLFGGAAIALALIGIAAAGPLEDGQAAYQRGDYATALRLLRPLAEQRNVDAQVQLGDLYLAGEGVPRDDAQAMNWYRKAADHGNARAQIRVGDMYDNAHSVFWDYAQAVAWYRKAADAGNAEGQYKLGLMYDFGDGVPQDYLSAHMWFNLAASRGSGMGASDRDLVAAKMTPAQIAEAQRMAREWAPK